MGEVLFILAMLGLMVAPWWLINVSRYWAAMWSSVAGLVIAVEIVSKVATRRTISQQFWAFGVDNLVLAWVLVGCMIGAIVVLAWHLMAGVYKRRNRRKK